jgi:exosortase K
MSAVARGDRVAALVILGLALAAALALKLHYSAASADDLRWILAPTAGLVELATGAGFVAEAGTGYLSTELRYLIAPSCAGVNFLIVAFCALSFGFVRPHRRAAENALIAAASAAAAFAAALVANTLRIALAIWLHVHAVSWGWLTPDRLHRVAGVAVYLTLLLALFAAARRLAARRRAHPATTSPARDTPSAGMWLPVCAYLGVALLVPLINGGHARADFWEHAAVVVAVLVGAALVVAALRRVRGRAASLLAPAPALVEQRLACRRP